MESSRYLGDVIPVSLFETDAGCVGGASLSVALAGAVDGNDDTIGMEEEKVAIACLLAEQADVFESRVGRQNIMIPKSKVLVYGNILNSWLVRFRRSMICWTITHPAVGSIENGTMASRFLVSIGLKGRDGLDRERMVYGINSIQEKSMVSFLMPPR